MVAQISVNNAALCSKEVARSSQQRRVHTVCALRSVSVRSASYGGVTLCMRSGFESSKISLSNGMNKFSGLHRPVKVHAAAGDDKDDLGEQAFKDMANLDKLIDSMLEANDEQMPVIIGQSVMQLNQKFFMRIATRCDSTSDQEAKEKLGHLSVKVMRLLEELVKQTTTSMSTSGEILQKIVAAAADPNTGEFMVPLSPKEIQSMRKAMSENYSKVDEAVVAQAYSWIRKSGDDGLKGMVEILQRVLQLYGAFALVPECKPSDEEGTAARALEDVLAADVEDWPRLLKDADDAGFGTGAFSGELQKRMEQVVLGMANGSYTQRVLAEYLKEVEERAKETFPKVQK